MDRFKKIFLFSTVIMIFVMAIFVMTQKSNTVRAEDDDEYEQEEEDDEEEEDDDKYEVIDTSPDKNEVKKTEYKTVTTKLSDTVTKTSITETKHDSDGDGVFDEEDAHPTINEHFIVKDDNLNGIDDKYEQL
jgi:hypothetical protein